MNFVNPSFRCLVLVSCLLVLRTAEAQEIRVAAAADLKFALDELGAQFEKQTGRRINVSYGSSRNFFPQTPNAAPFDPFLSPATKHPPQLDVPALPHPL